MIEQVKALRLPWDTVSKLIGQEISGIIGYPVRCIVKRDDDHYWATNLKDNPLPLSAFFKVMETIQADQETIEDSTYDTLIRDSEAICIGMDATRLLLQRTMKYQWEVEYIGEQYLWLLGQKE